MHRQYNCTRDRLESAATSAARAQAEEEKKIAEARWLKNVWPASRSTPSQPVFRVDAARVPLHQGIAPQYPSMSRDALRTMECAVPASTIMIVGSEDSGRRARMA